MSRHSAAEARSSDARTIGDILLSRGFVTREVLDEALARQQTSGKPLGQILVEEGAISRLELASALAEQWSDIGSVSPDFGIGPTPSGLDSPLLELEELRYSRRMLEERLRAWEQSPQRAEGAEDRTVLLSRLVDVEAAVADLRARDGSQQEAGGFHETVEQIGRRLDDMSAAVSALGDQQQSGERIDDVDRRLSTLGGAVERAFEEMERRADESRDTLATLAGEIAAIPVADVASVTARVTELEARVAAVDPTERIDELSTSLHALARSIDERPDPMDDLAEMRRRIDVLADDGALVATLQERAEDLEQRFERRAAAFESRFQELFTVSQAPGELAETVAELTRRVDALASRPAAEGEADGRIAELSVRFDHLSAAIEALGDRPAGVAHDITERLDALGVAVAELESRPTADPVLSAHVEELGRQVGEIAARPDPTADLRGVVADLGVRVDELAPGDDVGDRLDVLTGRIEAIETKPEHDASLPASVESLASRADQLERRDVELAQRVEDLVATHRAGHGTGEELADLVARLEAMEQSAGTTAEKLRDVGDAMSARDAEIDARIETLSARLDAPRPRAPTSVSDALAGDGAPRAAGETHDVERLRMMVERLMHDFADHRRAVSSALSSREFTALLEELAARVDELQEGGVVAAPGGAGPAGGRAEVRELTRRLDDVEESVRESRDGVFQRLERMMGTIDWRLQRLEHPEQAED